MTTAGLAAALRACAAGLYPLEAGVGLLIANGTFLRRSDFTSRFILHGTSSDTHMAAVDWDAATTALAAGELPCSASSGSSCSRPASPTASRLTSATPSPASTSTTPTCSWPRSVTRQDIGPHPHHQRPVVIRVTNRPELSRHANPARHVSSLSDHQNQRRHAITRTRGLRTKRRPAGTVHRTRRRVAALSLPASCRS